MDKAAVGSVVVVVALSVGTRAADSCLSISVWSQWRQGDIALGAIELTRLKAKQFLEEE